MLNGKLINRSFSMLLIQPLVVLQIFCKYDIMTQEVMNMDPATFGPFLKEARSRCGMTQMQLAEQLHVSTAAVSKWERGLAKPRADKLPILAKLYGCTIEELLADDAEQEE